MAKKRYVLLVSGGPDSIYLLHQYASEALAVVHVNYQKRPTSDDDAALVQDAARALNVPCYTLVIKPNDLRGNFQAAARQVRYDYAKQICDQLACQAIVTAHHKDDFLETGLMQLASGRAPRQFGISKYALYQKTTLYRPLLKIPKTTILTYLAKHGISYAIDQSNELPIYERNRVRQELKALSAKEIKQRYDWLIMANRILRKKNRRVDAKVRKWAQSNYALAFWKALKRDREEVLFNALHNLTNDLNLPKAKLLSLIAFLDAETGQKSFKLNAKTCIVKMNNLMQIKPL